MNRYMTTGRRGGRMTVAQDKIMKSAAENKYLIGVKDLQVWLNRSGQKVVEVGFGMGESLHMMSAHNTDDQYLGIDVYKPGVAALLKKIGHEPVSNLCVMHDDAIDVLSMLPDQSIHRIQCYFPDPWRKKRHRKRRLFHTVFTKELKRVLKPDGLWHLITDWMDYADDLVHTLQGEWVVVNEVPAFFRPVTKYESRGLKKGHQIYEFLISKQ